jgi:hypothetical protein
MKKTILTLFFIVFSLVLTAQTYYKATLTEMYTLDKTTNEWSLYQKNSDVSITVVVEPEFISFQAKKPTMYKVYENTKEPVNTKSLSGYRYTGKDLREDQMVKMDVLVHKESKTAIVSIINYSQGYNFRFFLTEVIE